MSYFQQQQYSNDSRINKTCNFLLNKVQAMRSLDSEDEKEIKDVEFILNCVQLSRSFDKLTKAALHNSLRIFVDLLGISLRRSINSLKKMELIMEIQQVLYNFDPNKSDPALNQIFLTEKISDDFKFKQQPQYSDLFVQVLNKKNFFINVPSDFLFCKQFRFLTRHRITPEQIPFALYKRLSTQPESNYYDLDNIIDQKPTFDSTTSMFTLLVPLDLQVYEFLFNQAKSNRSIDSFLRTAYTKYIVKYNQNQIFEPIPSQLLIGDSLFDTQQLFIDYVSKNQTKMLYSSQNWESTQDVFVVKNNSVFFKFEIGVPNGVSAKQLKDSTYVTLLYKEHQVLSSIKSLIISVVRSLLYYYFSMFDSHQQQNKANDINRFNWVDVVEIDINYSIKQFQQYYRLHKEQFLQQYDKYISFFLQEDAPDKYKVSLLTQNLFQQVINFEEDDVSQDSIQISFVDIITKSLIEKPARGSLCTHYQIFDEVQMDVEYCPICQSLRKTNVSDHLLMIIRKFYAKQNKKLISISLSTQFMKILETKFLEDEEHNSDGWFDESPPQKVKVPSVKPLTKYNLPLSDTEERMFQLDSSESPQKSVSSRIPTTIYSALVQNERVPSRFATQQARNPLEAAHQFAFLFEGTVFMPMGSSNDPAQTTRPLSSGRWVQTIQSDQTLANRQSDALLNQRRPYSKPDDVPLRFEAAPAQKAAEVSKKQGKASDSVVSIDSDGDRAPQKGQSKGADDSVVSID